MPPPPPPHPDPSNPSPENPTAGEYAEQKNKEAEQKIEDLQEDAGRADEIAGGSPGDSPTPADPGDDAP